ncbi:MAG TPA: glycosyltransferase family 39 protein [Vicinamibacterales bacterium]|nr:glycosyltransferase family 39 protein [Vicinamibacterales bacterium]
MKMTGWGAAAAITVAVAAALRFYGLGSQLWFDEIVTLVESARRPLLDVLTYFPDVNVHPFYSVLAHASLESFGESAWALRLPACLFGIASVAMVFALGGRVTDRVETWAGASVLAVSYQHIWFSQNARGYTMMGFFALVSTYFLVRLAETERRAHFVYYALACAAGVYTHLTMAFVVAGHAVVLVGGKLAGWRAADRPALAPLLAAWAGAALLTLGLYAPYFPELLEHFGGSDAPKQAAQVATGKWALTEILRNLFSGSGIAGALLTSMTAGIGALSFLRRDRFTFALLVVPAIVAGLAIVLLGQPIRPRFFFFMAGALAIFAGRGIGVLARIENPRSTPTVATVAALTLVVIGVSAFALPRNYLVPKQNFDESVHYLEGEFAAGAVIGAAGPACFPVERYYAKADWPCLKSVADLDALAASNRPVLVLHTLGDYIDDGALRDRIKTACREVRRWPGTLGGGDMVVCRP